MKVVQRIAKQPDLHMEGNISLLMYTFLCNLSFNDLGGQGFNILLLGI